MSYNSVTTESKLYLPDFIDTITTSIKSGGYPLFRTGYWNELREINAGMSLNQSVKYPIIYLPLNSVMKFSNESTTFEIDFELYIITSSSRYYSFEDRLDNVIKVTLEPIYDNLMTALKNHKWLRKNRRVLDHQKRYLTYDKTNPENVEQNQLNEVVEAIHLSFTNLLFNNLQNL